MSDSVAYGGRFYKKRAREFAMSPGVLLSLNYDQGDTLGGGQNIVITGTNLGSVTAVNFGGTAAAIVSNTSTTVTCTLPAKSAGVTTVNVVTGGVASNTLSFEYWDPGELTSTTGFWENYTGSPWIARAGSVGGKLNAVSTNGLSVGTGSGGFSSAQFAGGGNTGRLKSSTPDTTRYINQWYSQQGSGTTASIIWALAKPATSGGAYSAGAPYLDRAIIGTDAGGYLILSHNNSGFLGNVYDGAYDAAIAPCTFGTGASGLNAWHMAVFRTTTSVSQMSVDGSLLANASTTQNLSVAVGSPYVLQIGTDYSGGNQFGGEILAFGATRADGSDADVLKLRKWAMQRFGVTV